MNGENVAVIEGGNIYYVRTDHIGRPVFATNGLGIKVWEASYPPFGGVHTATGSISSLRFPGQWFQSEAALHQNWMRDYTPTTGRYIQADPLGLIDSASAYNYFSLNPHSYIDPRGERGVSSSSMGQSFGIRSPSIGFGVKPHERYPMSGWPHFKPKNTPDHTNVNEGQQCSRNVCMRVGKVAPAKMVEAGLFGKNDSVPSGVKGCSYHCPGGKKN